MESSSLPLHPALEALATLDGRAIASSWSAPCEALFEALVEFDSEELGRVIDSRRLKTADLTFAAEILGRSSDSNLVRETVLPLLLHPDAVVREGAIYGLRSHLDPLGRQALAELGARDTSVAVRRAAQDATTS